MIQDIKVRIFIKCIKAHLIQKDVIKRNLETKQTEIAKN